MKLHPAAGQLKLSETPLARIQRLIEFKKTEKIDIVRFTLVRFRGLDRPFLLFSDRVKQNVSSHFQTFCHILS